ncbi:MAG: PKD domain-containing protein [Bacteroidia bacterium]
MLLFFFPLLAQSQNCTGLTIDVDSSYNCEGCLKLSANMVGGRSTSSYQVQQIPYTPFPFNAGTIVNPNVDDIWSAAILIGFPFCFYDTTYTQLVIGSNGIISFDLSYANGYCTWPISVGIPGNIDTRSSIMGPYYDLDPSVGGAVRWQQYGTAPCRKFVISWDAVPLFSCNNLVGTEQIVLYESTNVIEMYVQDKPTCSGWNGGYLIQGIQDASITQADTVPGRNYPSLWSGTNDAYRFEPSGPGVTQVEWYRSGQSNPIGTTDSIILCPTGPETISCEATLLACGGQSLVLSASVNIYPGMGLPPGTAFSYTTTGNTANFQNQSTGIVTACLWDFGDGGFSSICNPSHTFANPGTYFVCLTSFNQSCSSQDCDTVVVLPTAVSDPLSGFSVSCGPNPFREATILLMGLQSLEMVRVEAYDLQGRLLGRLDHQPSAPGNIHLSVSKSALGLTNGMCLLKVSVGDHTKTVRVAVLP